LIFIIKKLMTKTKNTNLTFTINVKDFNNDKDVVDYLMEAINTSLQLNNDNDFNNRMKEVDNLKLSLKKNLKIKIQDCGCI
jgi:hypothetical protein